MMYSAVAILAAVAGVAATGHPHGNVTVVTEVVESYTTYCPGPTEITHGTMTYTVTEPTTLTITDCPCTVTKPVIPTSEVICHECEEPTVAPPAPPAATTPVAPPPPPPVETPEVPPPVPTAGAGKAMPFLAGLAGLVAFAL